MPTFRVDHDGQERQRSAFAARAAPLAGRIGLCAIAIASMIAALRFAPARAVRSARPAERTWTVTTARDVGAGSLREAMEGLAPGDTIAFDSATFPVQRPVTIELLSALPAIACADVTIDAVGRGVVIDGDRVPASCHGLTVTAPRARVRGLVLSGFAGCGIAVSDVGDVVVGGNRFAGEGNVIHACGCGVSISGRGAVGNVVAGNLLGLDATGRYPVANTGFGVEIVGEARSNRVGGTGAGEGNVISGNLAGGVSIKHLGTDSNVIEGNWIGTDASGTVAVASGSYGIQVRSRASNTRIGGARPNAGNVVATATNTGVRIQDPGTIGTIVQGNNIGTDPDGVRALPNAVGISIAFGATETVVGGDTPDAANLVSGNIDEGIVVSGLGTQRNTIHGNLVGTTADGQAELGNGGAGVVLMERATGNHVGRRRDASVGFGEGLCAGGCNVVAANGSVGIDVKDAGTADNVIAGNHIGTDATGVLDLGNGGAGVLLREGVAGNMVGGADPMSGNRIRYNAGPGVSLDATTSAITVTGNVIERNDGAPVIYQPGNQLGVNPCRDNGINAIEVRPGTIAAAGEMWSPQGETARYVVRADRHATPSLTVPRGATWTPAPGIEILFDSGLGIDVFGTLDARGRSDARITLGPSGVTPPLTAPRWTGVELESGSTATLSAVDVTAAAVGLSVDDADVAISNTTITECLDEGLHATGDAPLVVTRSTFVGNGGCGIVLEHQENARIGGDARVGEGNVFGRNESCGIRVTGDRAAGNVIVGNRIGTDAAGMVADGNAGGGVELCAGAHDNRVGDASPGAANVIAGNHTGVQLRDADTDGNIVVGNLIGINAAGQFALPNRGNGVLINLGAARNRIGGSGDGEGNTISGNATGIAVAGRSTAGNTIVGNRIGTDRTGSRAVPNDADGIVIWSGATITIVGDGTAAGRNIVSGNGSFGIRIQDPQTSGTVVEGNFVGTDATGTRAIPNEIGVKIGIGVRDARIGGQTALQGNTISGNNVDGIHISTSGGAGIRIQGNRIGTSADGDAPLGNGASGVTIATGVSGILVGGPSAHGGSAASAPSCSGPCNLIGGNRGDGITLLEGATGNTIQGNAMGTDASGTGRIGNDRAGVRALSGSSGNTIGGRDPGDGNLVRFNGSGVGLVRGTVGNTLDGNVIADNDGVAIAYALGNRLGTNDCRGNAGNHVLVATGDVGTEGESWQVQGEARTFVITVAGRAGEEGVTVPRGTSWTVGPGVEVRFDAGLGACVEGSLTALGTADAPVTFGPAEIIRAARPGDWPGLRFEPGSVGRLDRTTVEFGTYGFYVDDADVTVSNSVVTASAVDGVVVVGDDAAFAIRHSTVAGNRMYGLNNQSPKTIDATGVWWGHASGPRASASNPNGLGDGVLRNTRIDGWLRDPGANDTSRQAVVLNPGRHEFPISHRRDLDWFRVPLLPDTHVTAALSALPRDYDLYLFGRLESASPSTHSAGQALSIGQAMTIGQAMSIGRPDATGQAMSIGQAMTIGQLAEVGDGFDTARLLAAGTLEGTATESVSTGTWDQSGWYHILVAGHNGANNPSPYTLDLTVTRAPEHRTAYEPLTFEPPSFISPTVRTLILTNPYRMALRHGRAATDRMLSALDRLAVHDAVAGRVVRLDSTDAISRTYAAWDENVLDPTRANVVASAIRAMLIVTRTAYPDLEYIVIAGDDTVVPFWRTPDETLLANEATYGAGVGTTSPVGVALGQQWFLADDPYAAPDLVPWRGRGLALPAYGIGRLVETPAEIEAAIGAFLHRPVIDARTGLVTGYDFLEDTAAALSALWARLTLTNLVGPSWRADDLRSRWLEVPHDVSVVNAHFEHWRALPADRSAGDVSAAEIARDGHFAGTLGLSVGCHAGLSVPDDQVAANPLDFDFPQAVLAQGGAWIANTGFGYGDADAIGYSELLAVLLNRHLVDGVPLGHALRHAKADYLARTGIHAFGALDEKVLAELVLYGLPMVRLSVPGVAHVGDVIQVDPPCTVGPGADAAADLTTRTVSCAPHFEPADASAPTAPGTYFTIGGETQVIAGEPIQPRTSVDISLADKTAHGALFEGGRYRSLTAFDPVVTRAITEDGRIDLWAREPGYDHPETWQPSQWALVNRVPVSDVPGERLVVVPAQFRSTTAEHGTERLIEAFRYTVYYTRSHDIVPPSIWYVYTESGAGSDTTRVTAEVTDLSDVVRVAATYTDGAGEWVTRDLVRDDADVNLWQGEVPRADTLEWFVQAVDRAGNVAVSDNRGTYYGSRVDAPPFGVPPTPTPTPTATVTPSATSTASSATPGVPAGCLWLPRVVRSVQ